MINQFEKEILEESTEKSFEGSIGIFIGISIGRLNTILVSISTKYWYKILFSFRFDSYF